MTIRKRTFRSVSSPIKYVCTAFGVAMFSEFESHIAHCLSVVYSFVIASILFAAIVFRINYVSPTYGRFKVLIHSVICIQQIFILLTVLAIYYQSIRYPNRMRTVFQLLARIDQTFAQFNVEFDYRLFQWKIAIEVILLSASIHIAFVALCTYYSIDPFAAIIYELLARFYPIFVINATLLMFINLCFLIKSKFTALEKVLRRFHGVNDGPSADSKVKVISIAPTKFHTELKQIVGVYESLYGIVNQLNHIFGLSNLAALALAAISLTCHLFLLVKILMENTSSIDGVCFELFGAYRSTVQRNKIIFNESSLFSFAFSVSCLDASHACIHFSDMLLGCRWGQYHSSADTRHSDEIRSRRCEFHRCELLRMIKISILQFQSILN